MTSKFVRWAAALATFAFFAGCDKYNRADISSDGKTIALSLGDKGFQTDASSEVYLFDVDSCSMKRVTFDNQCNAWVDIEGKGLAYTTGKEFEGTVEVIGATKDNARSIVATGMANTPVILPDGLFYSNVSPKKGGNERDTRITFNLWQPPFGTEVLGEFPVDINRKFLFSTLPAFYKDEVLFYAIADVSGLAARDKKQPPKGVFRVEIFALDIATKKSIPITKFEFPRATDAKGLPVGYVDLAISPDGETLICCFLPPNDLSIKTFSDKLASTVYLVDVRTGKQTLFRSDKNMYYPRWKDVPESATTRSTTQPAEEPKFLYLSGTGFKEGRGVWITDLRKTSLKLADLPDKVMEGYSGWTWLTEHHVRIFHVGKSGLVLVDVNEDGTEKRTAVLTMDQLMTLKARADVEGSITFLKEQLASTSVLVGKPEAKALKTGYDQAIAEITRKLQAMKNVKIDYTRK